MKCEAGLMVGRGKILPIFVPKGGVCSLESVMLETLSPTEDEADDSTSVY